MTDPALTFTTTELQNLRASQYVSAVGLVILLWDHFLTIHDEVELVWRAQMSFPKLLFLFNRYVVPICLIILTYVGFQTTFFQIRSVKHGLVSA